VHLIYIILMWYGINPYNNKMEITGLWKCHSYLFCSKVLGRHYFSDAVVPIL